MYRRNYCSNPPAPQPMPPAPKPRDFPRMALTVADLMDELQISRAKAYELVEEPGFPAFTLGKRILINRAGLQRWMDERSAQPPSPPSPTAA